ncbi:MAG: hypothetical protein QOD06_319 [Candidatus Binatota bacterium]|jgi:F420-dependent oxidoreductase-like protein|nr:hypothetical protein [Candidatus Binatota bacterium]
MSRHPIRFGLQTGQQNVDWMTLRDFWQKADGWGYDSLWNFDHFYPIFTDPSGPCLEAWTTLAALSQVTSNARIGHLVNGNTYRNPALVAKMAATLDHASAGRFVLGIGAGWFEHEHESLGVDFKTVRGRLEALDESLRILRGMFTEEKTTFHGKHYTVNGAMCVPKPLQKPHPPILIGGTGEKVLLRIVAEHANMWNAMGSVDQMRHRIEVLHRHGESVGRDAGTIEKTVGMMLCYRATKEREKVMTGIVANMRQVTQGAARDLMMVGDRDECLERIGRYVAVGVTHFIFMLIAPYFADEVQAFAEEVIPAAREM